MTATDLTEPHRTAPSWWSDRWAWRGTLAAAPLGALLAILHALLVLRTGVGEALTAYVIGALVAAGLGCLLGGTLGAAGTSFRHRHCTRLDPAHVEALHVEDEAYVEHEERTYAAAA